VHKKEDVYILTHPPKESSQDPTPALPEGEGVPNGQGFCWMRIPSLRSPYLRAGGCVFSYS